MRRLFALSIVLVGGIGILSFGTGAGGSDGEYLVRAMFDNGGFLVPGEEVRIAGARVGSIDEVDVSGLDEPVHEDGGPDPGKAVVVMAIDDPGFQNFREDASCLIRPQSLLGEKFVECEPTQPRSAGSQAPPELEVIPDGEAGAGQRFLPIERNGKSVDLDLVNNIMEEPYPDRFRLIINNLGAGLAARGEELGEIVDRANPALRETNEVLAILEDQTKDLETLASDGERVVSALAREREHLAGFTSNAAIAGAATAEKGAELEEGLAKLPGFLRELRPTMDSLRSFSEASTPVIADFGEAAPAITRSTKALGPFSKAGTRALISLGNAADKAGPDLVASVPVLRDTRTLAKKTVSPAKKLDKLLKNLRTSGGTRALTALIFNAANGVNGFDSFGHFVRTMIPVNNCFTYKVTPEASCDANFTRTFTARQARRAQKRNLKPVGNDKPSPSAGGVVADILDVIGEIALGGGDEEPTQPQEPTDPTPPEEPSEPPVGEPDGGGRGAEGDAGAATGTERTAASAPALRDTRAILDFLIGPADGGAR